MKEGINLVNDGEKSCASCYHNEDLLCNKKGIFIPLEHENECVCHLWEDMNKPVEKE